MGYTQGLIDSGQETNLATLANSFDFVYSTLVGSQPVRKQSANGNLTTNIVSWSKGSRQKDLPYRQKELPYQTVNVLSPQYTVAKNILTSFAGDMLDVRQQRAVMEVATAFVELHANSNYIEQLLPQQFFENFGKEGHTLSDLMANPEDTIVNPMFFVQDNFANAVKPKQEYVIE